MVVGTKFRPARQSGGWLIFGTWRADAPDSHSGNRTPCGVLSPTCVKHALHVPWLLIGSTDHIQYIAP